MRQVREKKLIVESVKGDRQAYAQLVRMHYKQVFLLCLGILGNVHDAEDIVQETMLKGFTELGKLKEKSKFGSWLSTIARNASINLIRSKRRRKQAIQTKAQSAGHSDCSSHAELEQAIRTLPPDLRMPLVMYYFDGRNVKSVSENLGISTSSVYTKLRTALKQLHSSLSTEGPEK